MIALSTERSVPMVWEPGTKVVHRAQRSWGVGVVIQVTEEGRRLAVRFAGRDGITVVSGRDPALTAVPRDTPIEEVGAPGPLDALAAGQAGTGAAFQLRAQIARLEALRRADSLGALLSSRVHVLPHQVGAAGRVLADRSPRFVLADEVGLGKTIEAGLVFAGLRQLGLAERVLVVVPEHLAFQWLAELFHKFNALFTLLTPDRVAELGGGEAALARSPHAIVPLELLASDAALADAAADLPLDLVIVDEAHHLADDRHYEPVAPIARAAFGLLLLTATPLRLDPREYFRLLGLVEPVPSSSHEAFLARLSRHEGYAEIARGLLSGGSATDAAAQLRALEPDDPRFEGAPGADELLGHLADRYSLSSRLIRNRRVKVGAFTQRVLRRLEVAPGSKGEEVARLCADLAAQGEKVLVFGGELPGLRTLQAAIAGRGREALLYDDADSIEARDRLVARFRDPEGPMILLSGEAGGEGRNFQFAAHLICLDLPESPLTLEQRIGRLDRLGQHRPVEIHVVTEPGEEAFLASLYETEIGIFDEPVGGLDTVLASLPSELATIRAASEEERTEFRKRLAARVAEGRRAQHEGYDPLLDLRSASLPELSALVESAFQRSGEEPVAGSGGADAIQQALLALSRSMEERLEDACVDVARRVGVDVDTDQNVHPFEVAFTIGQHLRVDALPGMQIPEEPLTMLGSFWRETAVARDELQWFATGNRLVEALVGLVRDGEVGRTAVFRSGAAPRRGALHTRWHLVWPSPADLSPGSRVPSRQASRYLDGAPIEVAVDLGEANRLVPAVVAALRPDEEPPEARVGPVPRTMIDAAHRASEEAARELLSARRDAALEKLQEHANAEEERLVVAAFQGGAAREVVDAALAALRAHRAATEDALRRVRLELDAAAVVLPS